MKEKLMKDIINKIEEYDTIAIYRHVFPDPDSYGSQTALKSIINNTYPNKKVVILGEHSKNLEAPSPSAANILVIFSITTYNAFLNRSKSAFFSVISAFPAKQFAITLTMSFV